jgi:hypothetical protein
MFFPEGSVKPFISDVAQTIKSQLCRPLLQQYWLNFDLVILGDAAEVIQKSRDLQEVQRTVVAVPGWVVMISMNGEDWYGNIDVGVFVVDVRKSAIEYVVGVTHQLQLTWLLSQTVLSEGSHDLVHSFSRRLVVMKQISS